MLRSSEAGPVSLDRSKDVFQGSALTRMIRAHEISVANQQPFNVSTMRTNMMLTEEQWRQIDDSIVRAAQERLVIVDDLRARGLIHPLGGLGVLESEFRKLSDVAPAEQSMSGATSGERDIPEKDIAIVPIPITHKDFRLEGRFLLSSRRGPGEPIDVSAAEAAARSVAEKMEDVVFGGGDVVLGGNSILGITNHPDVGTHTVSTDWDAVTDNNDIIADALAMMQVAIDAGYYGPYALYVNGAWGMVLEEDYKAESERTVRQRLLAIEGLNTVRIADRGLAAGASEVALIQMTSNVIDLAVGQELTTVDWETEGGMIMHFKVMMAASPRVKSDYSGNSGIVIGSG